MYEGTEEVFGAKMRRLIAARVGRRMDAEIETAVGVEHGREAGVEHKWRWCACRQKQLGHRVNLRARIIAGHQRKRVCAQIQTVRIESDQRLVLKTGAAKPVRGRMQAEQV